MNTSHLLLQSKFHERRLAKPQLLKHFELIKIMCYLVLRLFRFLPPDEEEIINLLNKKRIDHDFSVQTIEKHTAECVMYGFHSTYGPPCKVTALLIYFLFIFLFLALT